MPSGSVSLTNIRLSLVNGTAFVDFSAVGTLTPYLNRKLILTDSAGKKAVGYIKAAGTGETYTDLLSGWDFTSGWTVQAGGAIDDSNTFTSTDVGGLRNSTDILTVGELLKLTLASDNGNTSLNIVHASGTFSMPAVQCANNTMKYGVVGYTATLGPCARLYVRLSDTGTSNISVLKGEKVLTPSSTGVTITSTRGGTTYNWESIETGFNYNDSAGYTYRLIPARKSFSLGFELGF